MQENIEDTVIISDTSCLIALTNAHRLDILKKRYKNIKVTPKVKSEYEKKGDILPSWIVVKKPNDEEWVNKLRNKFGDGEAESIVLAKEEKNALLVLDDMEARNYAIDMGITVTGTLGIIDSARKNNIINIDEAIDILNIIKNNNFRISDKILNDFINYMKIDNEKIII
jgi:predicted nucleic acid-binding protein